MDQPDAHRRGAAAPARLPRRGDRAPLRRARGARRALLRGAGAIGAQPRAGALGDAVPLDREPLPRLHARVRLLLRAARRTATSTSTRAATSSARSSSRSTRPRCCAGELARPSWTREHVALGTNTDPYQWVEARYRLMPGIWRALLEQRTPCSVLTKSPLLLRDIDAARGARGARGCSARRCRCRRSTSAPGGRPSRTRRIPAARLEAVAKLTAAGIPTSVLVAPLMPGHQRRPALGARDRQAGARGGCAQRHADRAAPARRACARSSWTGSSEIAPELVGALRRALRARRLPAPATSAGGSRSWCAPSVATRGRAPRASSSRRAAARRRDARAGRGAARAAASARRRRGACSERLSACRPGAPRTGARAPRAPSARPARAASAGARLARSAPRRIVERRDVDLAAVVDDRAHDRLGDPLGRASCPCRAAA